RYSLLTKMRSAVDEPTPAPLIRPFPSPLSQFPAVDPSAALTSWGTRNFVALDSFWPRTFAPFQRATSQSLSASSGSEPAPLPPPPPLSYTPSRPSVRRDTPPHVERRAEPDLVLLQHLPRGVVVAGFVRGSDGQREGRDGVLDDAAIGVHAKVVAQGVMVAH